MKNIAITLIRQRFQRRYPKGVNVSHFTRIKPGPGTEFFVTNLQNGVTQRWFTEIVGDRHTDMHMMLTRGSIIDKFKCLKIPVHQEYLDNITGPIHLDPKQEKVLLGYSDRKQI